MTTGPTNWIREDLERRGWELVAETVSAVRYRRPDTELGIVRTADVEAAVTTLRRGNGITYRTIWTSSDTPARLADAVARVG